MKQGSQEEPRQGRDLTSRARAWRSIMETHGAIVPELDNDLQEESGIDIQTYDALLHVFEAGEQGIRMADLAAAVVISKSGITSLVDRLEATTHVQRNPDPDDRRATRITLTASGEVTFRAAAKVHLAGIEEHFASHISDEEARCIAETLERVSRHGTAESSGAT
jgi:DNA-binding MarR family transcriptional regulator